MRGMRRRPSHTTASGSSTGGDMSKTRLGHPCQGQLDCKLFGANPLAGLLLHLLFVLLYGSVEGA